ncbi:unnamed protein product, partial [Meganyctiphanes norvegica]
MSRGSGLDGLLSYMGAPHPCVVLHLLITLGMFVLGLGSLETSMLLPVPLYSCWGGLDNTDLARTCQVAKIFPHTPLNEVRRVFECSDSKWQPYHWVGAVMVGMRTLVTIFAGIGADTFGRRRSAIVWLGLYFVVSFARSFAPNMDTVVFCVTLEAAAAQAVTISLLLIASEGSTQKECVRSVCLVFIGHAIGVGAGAPLINHYVPTETYRQIARSLPSLVFVLFIFGLPESGRWLVCRGQLQKATVALKKSHHIVFDPVVRPKLTTLYEEGNYGIYAVCLLDRDVCIISVYSELLTIFCEPRNMVRANFIGVRKSIGCATETRLHSTPAKPLVDQCSGCGILSHIMDLSFCITVSGCRQGKPTVFLLTLQYFCAVVKPLWPGLHTAAGLTECGLTRTRYFSSFQDCIMQLAITWLVIGSHRNVPRHTCSILVTRTLCPNIFQCILTRLRIEEFVNWKFGSGNYLMPHNVGNLLPSDFQKILKFFPHIMHLQKTERYRKDEQINSSVQKPSHVKFM